MSTKVSVLIVINKIGVHNLRFKTIYDFDQCTEALFIRHIFHYVFGLDYSQILITSISNQSFSVKPFNSITTNVISPPFGSKRPKQNINYNNSKIEFLCGISACGQVMHTQNLLQDYSFKFDGNIRGIVRPFNRHFLSQLKANNETELLVFLLDHGVPGRFSHKLFQEIFERIYKIPSKHIIIFNDSCYSGFLLQIIQASSFYKTDKIMSLSDFIYQLSQLPKNSKDSKEIGSLVQNLNNFQNESKEELYFNPELFFNLKQKSSVFCSAPSTNFSYSYPIRRFVLPSDTLYVSYGFPFIAAVMQALLYDDLSSLSDDLFASYINKNFKINSIFEKYSIPQLPDKKENITLFFSIDYDNSNYYSSSEISWFDFSSIRQKDKSKWNVEIQDIDVEKEYTEDVMEAAREQSLFLNLSLTHHENSEEDLDPERLGPTIGAEAWDQDKKYVYDFTRVVNDILKTKSLPCFNPNHVAATFSLYIPEFRKFYALFPEGSEYLYPEEIVYHPTYTYFLETPEDKRSLVLECFTEAFNKIDGYWRDIYTVL